MTNPAPVPRTWSEERQLKDVAWLAKLLGVSKSWVPIGVDTSAPSAEW